MHYSCLMNSARGASKKKKKKAKGKRQNVDMESKRSHNVEILMEKKIKEKSKHESLSGLA